MSPTISIVIPNRNDSKYLSACLRSVLTQSVPVDELVIIDDCSTDDSVELIKRETAGIPYVRLIENPVCLGSMGAANKGLELCGCDYVLFLSANDYLVDGLVERAKRDIATFGHPGVWSAMVYVVDESGDRLRLYPTPVISLKDSNHSPEACIRLAIRTGHWFTGTTLLYDRNALLDIGGFDMRYFGLADLIAALTIACNKGASFAPVPLGVMRQHEGGLMWRTLTDLSRLDHILEMAEEAGARQCPGLFQSIFFDLFRRRLRFTAIRAFRSDEWLPHVALWKGSRYRLLEAASPILSRCRTIQLGLAFIMLRPITDVFSIVWYRLLGGLLLRYRLGK